MIELYRSIQPPSKKAKSDTAKLFDHNFEEKRNKKPNKVGSLKPGPKLPPTPPSREIRSLFTVTTAPNLPVTASDPPVVSPLIKKRKKIQRKK